MPDPDRNERLHWRPMTADDVGAVSKLASEIHPDYPESDSVFRDKLERFPKGCFMLMDRDIPSGYLLSHPWKRCEPPPLDSLLPVLVQRPDSLYIHDLALAKAARGHAMGEQIIGEIVKLTQALKLPVISLVAVGGSERFWERQNFRVVDSEPLHEKLKSYGAQAVYMERSVS
ncbi:MAG: GNAT family N-acetyltransferase [Sphingorhabdus sp.]|nr:GNAT family N-acetyltransferase [Sphingorhabdus sp.]